MYSVHGTRTVESTRKRKSEQRQIEKIKKWWGYREKYLRHNYMREKYQSRKNIFLCKWGFSRRCRCVHWSVLFRFCVYFAFGVGVLMACTFLFFFFFFFFFVFTLLFCFIIFSGTSCFISFGSDFVETCTKPGWRDRDGAKTHRHRHTTHNYFAHSSVCVCDGHTEKNIQ